MGYCPTELKAGLGAGLGTRARRRGARHGAGSMGARAQGEGAHRRWARGASRHTGVQGEQGARGRQTLGRRAAGARGRRARAAGGRHNRGAWPAGRPGRGLGVQLGQWAVNLVHSACFDHV